jgi:adenine-specific DNA-methyltransferase
MKMYEHFIDKINELHNIIISPIDDTYKIMAIQKYKKLLDLREDKFSDLYIRLMGKNKEKGVVYTPKEIASYIVNNVLKLEDILNNPHLKILDPACGCGEILISCYFILKDIFEVNLHNINKINSLNLKRDEISNHIIKNNLFGFDIDDLALKILRIDIFELSGELSSNLKQADFLIDNIDEKFHIILGNPPYVGHKAIDKGYSKMLKASYKNIFKDKGDISYCFFQAALNNLSKSGKLAFITSRYFIESPSGEELRKILKEICSLYKIVDFYGLRPFKNVGIDPVIIFLKNKEDVSGDIEIIKPIHKLKRNKEKFYKSLFENEGSYYKQFYINKNTLNNKGWILRDEKERNIISKIEEKSFTHLYNICDSYQGIITGCDKAFVVDEKIIQEKRLERDIIKPWIKSSYINTQEVNYRDSYLICSDLIENPEDYPNTISYIQEYKNKLIERRECKNGVRKWYELQWGRKKEIFDEEKIVFPYKSSDNRFALDKGAYFSADVYALVLKENVPFTYEYLIELLNSKVYEFYFQSFAKKLGDNLYEYYPNNLMKLCLPTMGTISKVSDEELNYFFEFNEEEIRIIEECTK